MATDLAEILTDLRTEASRSPRNEAVAAADARTAMSRLRPALDRLCKDGLDTQPPTTSDPHAVSRQADRVHWARLLAGACDRLGHATPAPDPPGRLTCLADAAAIAATLHADILTSGERWAIVAALARTAHHLTTVAAGGEESAEVDRALIIAEASSSVLFQFASLDPPTASETAALRRPMPNPFAEPTSSMDAAMEASAALVHATRPGTGPHSIADILAITIATTTVCQSVGAAYLDAGNDRVAELARQAASAWGDVREQLSPFNDGSRRPQTSRPTAVDQALTLHRIVQQATPGPRALPPNTAPPAWTAWVTQEVGAVADHLVHALDAAVAGGRLMAYAIDLPIRESRVKPFLAGRRSSGLVAIDADDIAVARSALISAQVASATLAIKIRPTRVPSNGDEAFAKKDGRLPAEMSSGSTRFTAGAAFLQARRPHSSSTEPSCRR